VQLFGKANLFATTTARPVRAGDRGNFVRQRKNMAITLANVIESTAAPAIEDLRMWPVQLVTLNLLLVLQAVEREHWTTKATS